MDKNNEEIFKILAEAKILAQRYHVITGKPLGIAGEVAEFEATRLLGVTLGEARQVGYDATRVENGVTHRLQIKGRCVPTGSRKSQRLGSIDITKEFDGVLPVLMDDHLNVSAIYEADRDPVIAALTKPGSKSRNERGALNVLNLSLSVGESGCLNRQLEHDSESCPCRVEELRVSNTPRFALDARGNEICESKALK